MLHIEEERVARGRGPEARWRTSRATNCFGSSRLSSYRRAIRTLTYLLARFGAWWYIDFTRRTSTGAGVASSYPRSRRASLSLSLSLLPLVRNSRNAYFFRGKFTAYDPFPSSPSTSFLPSFVYAQLPRWHDATSLLRPPFSTPRINMPIILEKSTIRGFFLRLLPYEDHNNFVSEINCKNVPRYRAIHYVYNSGSRLHAKKGYFTTSRYIKVATRLQPAHVPLYRDDIYDALPSTVTLRCDFLSGGRNTFPRVRESRRVNWEEKRRRMRERGRHVRARERWCGSLTSSAATPRRCTLLIALAKKRWPVWPRV